jgi:multidrug efflux pump subunit AcrB
MVITLVTLLGALPLGIAEVGGLLVSQILNFHATPVVHQYIDRFVRKLRPNRVEIEH